MIRVLFPSQVATDYHIIIKQHVKITSNERKLLKTTQKLKIKNFCDIEILLEKNISNRMPCKNPNTIIMCVGDFNLRSFVTAHKRISEVIRDKWSKNESKLVESYKQIAVQHASTITQK